jgi:hypothetical protein
MPSQPVCSSETVPMLVPNPGEVARVIIGDKDMDQVSKEYLVMATHSKGQGCGPGQ